MTLTKTLLGAASLIALCAAAPVATPQASYPASAAPAPAGTARQQAAQTSETRVGVQLVAVTSAQLGAPMSGKLIAFPFKDGDRFKAGDTLAEFQCDQQRANLLHAQAEDGKRRQMLATQQKLKALGTYSTLDYQVAGSDLRAADADFALAQATVALCQVKAPFAGRVSASTAHNYQFVGVGTPLMEILDDSVLETEMIAPSSVLGWMKPGTGFDVRIRETGKTYHAVVDRFAGRVDPVSQTVKVYGKIDAAGSGLLPGMSGDAVLAQPAG